ncbi:MAG TPA: two-component regulator propeller domain-containing protein, partial [Vicinamibacterales bacterium]
MPRRPLAVAIALLACSALAGEWTPTRAFRTFSKSMWRGLPQSSVMALGQDRDGILWIGTLDGAASFDGRTITPVPAVKDAPLRGIIAGIAARKAGGVYIASQAGIHIFDGSAWTLVPTKRGPAAIAESRDGVLWMADTAGALRMLGRDGKWIEHPEVKANVVDISAAPDGTMWAATPTGALHIAGNRVDAVDGLPTAPNALLVAHDGRVWAATQGCTVHWTRGGGDTWHQVAFAPWPRGAFRCLAEDRRGRIWAGSYGGHIAFGTADGPWTVWDETNGPFAGGVMSIMCDRDGSVWFGINAVGMIQWIGEGWSHRLTVDPQNPGRNAFAGFGLARGATPGTLLVSVFSAGVLRLGPGLQERQYAAPEGITQDVRAVVEPEPGTMYVGARFGLFESDHGGPFKEVVHVPAGFVMGFFQSPDHRWYAATTTRGVFVRDTNGWQPAAEINAALPNMHVRGMTWLRNGELWIATLRGITVFSNGAARQLTQTTNRAMLESVNSILELPNGDVWAAGIGGIAVRHGNAWRRLTETDGIPGQTVYSLARGHNGDVWAGGSAGVGRFANGRWTVWDSREGLLQEECNLNGLLVNDDGTVFVSTMAGLGQFDPTIKPLPHQPLTIIWRTPPPRELARGDRALHLRWTAPYLGSHPVQYRVRVPRLHSDWGAPTPEDHLDIENLSAGDWRVEIEARVEGDRDWTPPLVLDTVVPPFW